MWHVLIPGLVYLQINDATVATIGVPGASVHPLVVGLNGVQRFGPALGSDGINMNDYWRHMTNVTEKQSTVFGETWSESLKRAVEDSEQLSDMLDRVVLTQTFPNDRVSSRMKAAANMILTAQDRGVDRDVIFLRVGSWDHHSSMKANLATQLTWLNTGLSVFESEMKAQGLWGSVTTAVVSEFGRTLTANSGMFTALMKPCAWIPMLTSSASFYCDVGDGSDHAWGGHYFLAGGSVSGGQILGNYPADISTAGPLNIGRGRIIPTSSWESMLTSAVQWMGLSTEAELDYCMPNRFRAGATLFSADQVFTSTRRSLRGENKTREGRN